MIDHGHGNQDEEHFQFQGSHFHSNVDHNHVLSHDDHGHTLHDQAHAHNDPSIEMLKEFKEPLIEKEHGHHHRSKNGEAHIQLRKQNLEEELCLQYDLIRMDNFKSEGYDSDNDEQAIKNFVSAKGKFATLLQIRNIIRSPILKKKPDRVLLLAGQILSRPKGEETESISDKSYLRKVIREEVRAMEDTHHHHFTSKSEFTPYILLIALSFHGFFEGIALGIQDEIKDTIFLFIAIISHKWAEAFTLGISFSKAGTRSSTFIKMIFIFSIFTPLGILLGIFLTSSSDFIEGIFLALSTGILIPIN